MAHASIREKNKHCQDKGEVRVQEFHLGDPCFKRLRDDLCLPFLWEPYVYTLTAQLHQLSVFQEGILCSNQHLIKWHWDSTPIWCRGWCHSTTHPTGSSLRYTADWCPQQEPCGRVGWGLVKHREFFSHWVKSVHKDHDCRSHPRKQPYFLTKCLVRWGEPLKLL